MEAETRERVARADPNPKDQRMQLNQDDRPACEALAQALTKRAATSADEVTDAAGVYQKLVRAGFVLLPIDDLNEVLTFTIGVDPGPEDSAFAAVVRTTRLAGLATPHAYPEADEVADVTGTESAAYFCSAHQQFCTPSIQGPNDGRYPIPPGT